MAEVERAAAEIELFEEYIDDLITLHHNDTPDVDWAGLAASSEPTYQAPAPTKPAAEKALAEYKPGRLHSKKRQARDGGALEAAVVQAEQADEDAKAQSSKDHESAVEEWKRQVALAKRIMAEDRQAWSEAANQIDQLTGGQYIRFIDLDVPPSGPPTVKFGLQEQDIVPSKKKSKHVEQAPNDLDYVVNLCVEEHLVKALADLPFFPTDGLPVWVGGEHRVGRLGDRLRAGYADAMLEHPEDTEPVHGQVAVLPGLVGFHRFASQLQQLLEGLLSVHLPLVKHTSDLFGPFPYRTQIRGFPGPFPYLLVENLQQVEHFHRVGYVVVGEKGQHALVEFVNLIRVCNPAVDLISALDDSRPGSATQIGPITDRLLNYGVDLRLRDRLNYLTFSQGDPYRNGAIDTRRGG